MNFSESSLKKLETCDKKLQRIAHEAIKMPPYDFGIDTGHRTVEEQKELFAKGRTKQGSIVTYCDGEIKKSKHNYYPSKAFDIKVYTNGSITWDAQYFIAVGKHIKDCAKKLGIKITWGADFKTLKDYPHFEID